MLAQSTAPVLQNNPDLALESYTRSSIEQVVTIAAGGFGSINVYGKSFRLVEATAPVLISTDKTGPKQYREGQGEDFDEQMRFKRLEIKNETSAIVTLRVWAGFGKFLDSRVRVLEAYTKIRGSATVSIANNTTVTFAGTQSGDFLQRKAFVISNMDPNNSIFLMDSDGNHCLAIFKESTITVPVSGSISVRNESGAAVSVKISEIFYALAP